MRSILFSLLFLTISLAASAQGQFYIKYEASVSSDDPGMAMMVGMMEGSTMIIATDGVRTYTKTTMGAMSTTEIEYNSKTNEMTMFMSGMMGEMAFAGNADSLDTDDSSASPEFSYHKDKKTILGYKCLKATSEDAEGNVSTYWYTESLKPAQGTQNATSALPGACLEMEVVNSMVTIKYTATKVKDKVNMDDYKIEIPESVEIQSWEDLNNMTGGM